MNAGVKWIGGTSLVLLAALGIALFAGRSLEAQEVMDNWLTAEDVLADDADSAALAGGEAPAGGDAEGGDAPDGAAPSPAQIYDSERGFDPVDPQYISQSVVQDVPAYDPDDPFVIKRILPIEGPIKYGEWHWDDAGVPDGPLRITVDLQARVISVFRDGYEIGAAAAMLWTEKQHTPTGVFPILT